MDMVSLWASLSIWLACLWVAFWQCYFIYKVMDILGKNPKMTPFFLTIAILWVALIESSAIFWLIVAMQLLWAEFSSPLASLWAWLAIWLTWLWVWMWEWLIVEQAVVAANKNTDEKNKILSYMILLIALVESTAIYWIIVAMRIIWEKDMWALVSLWAWLSIWVTGLWVSLWMSFIARKAMEVIWEHTLENNKIIIPFTILWLALIESAAIYWLVVAFQIIWWDPSTVWLNSIWAWLAVWLAWLWVWLWEWYIWERAMQAMTVNWASRAKITTYMVLFIAMVESLAIYWLIIAIRLVWHNDLWIWALWAWVAIWLAWAWVALWWGFLSGKSIRLIWKRPELTWFLVTVSILWMAILESSWIYGLIVSFQIIGHEAMWVLAIWSWLAIWLAWGWVWLAAGHVISWAFEAIARNPKEKTKYLTFMILFVALIEVLAIYWFIIAFQILWKAS